MRNIRSKISCTDSFLDLHGLGMGHLSMMYVIQQFGVIDGPNYPELLRKVFVLNVPPVFGMVWNGVKYIWSSGQKDRMKFICMIDSLSFYESSKSIMKRVLILLFFLIFFE